MPVYEFKKNDILYNSVETHPHYEFFLYSGSMYINNFSSSAENIPNGYVSLHEMNVDRDESLHTWEPDTGTGNKNLIYPFVTKDGSGDAFATVSTTNFRFGGYGDVITGSYMMTASIDRKYMASGSSSPNRSYIKSLRNTVDFYKRVSPKYDFDKYDYDNHPLQLVSIPSIFFGTNIEKGSVRLKLYVTGTLAAELHDVNKNGELIQVTPAESSAATATIITCVEADIQDTKDFTLTNAAGVTVTFNFTGGKATSTNTVAYDASSDITVDIGYSDLGSGDAGLTGDQIVARINAGANIDMVATKSGDNVLVTQGTLGTVGNTTITQPAGATGLTTPASFAGGYNTGSCEGLVLYNEGFLILTGTSEVVKTEDNYNICNLSGGMDATQNSFSWHFWGEMGSTTSAWGSGSCVADDGSQIQSSSYGLEFRGTNRVPTLTMFAHAPKGQLNYSNNQTYHESGSVLISSSGSKDYVENKYIRMANTVTSSYENFDAPFEKQTFISTIKIYDENHDCIAIAKLARPIKKLEERGYTFKLNMDV